jgi:tetraacyldisaccharide 4'-kinase
LFFDFNIIKSISFDIPVISIGNITAGGTGKTPHVEYLVNLLQPYCKIAVLSRGYKRKSKGFVVAGKRTPVKEIGDEPRQIKLKFPGIIMAVDNKRVHGIKQLITEFPGIEVILLDDAFQHRYVKAGLSIVLVNYERPVFKDFILPLGNLREYRCNLNRADIVIITKCPPDINNIKRQKFIKNLKLKHNQPVFFTTYDYNNPVPLFRKKTLPISFKQIKKENAEILLVTGIASNKPLKDYLLKYSAAITELAFPDHHAYRKKDIDLIKRKFNQLVSPAKIILTTEKDAVRLMEWNTELGNLKQFIHYVPVGVKFLAKGEKPFIKRIHKYVWGNPEK